MILNAFKCEEYQITALSLTAAIANGIDVEQIIRVLVKLSKNVIPDWVGCRHRLGIYVERRQYPQVIDMGSH